MSGGAVPPWLTQPVALAADNFTPLARTPWGGRVIGREYKPSVASAAGQAIGESWEFSCDPAFPSRLVGRTETLLQVVEAYPEAVLSPKLAAAGRSCEILVKLLDAAEPLSLQVHPRDGDANLQPGECGKPESWLVLQAAPGAGIYLGFSRPLSRAELRRALAQGDAARALLHFVPVQPGDYFEIEPGVPHAIGGGVTLLEPQRILLGQAGKTYRLWDWGRLYDASGREDRAAGKPRPLHMEESLPLVDPERQVGEGYVATLRRQPTLRTVGAAALGTRPDGASHLTQPGPLAVSVREFPTNPYYKTALYSLPAGASLRLAVQDGYGAMVMLRGAVTAGGQTFAAGEPALLPHAAMPLTLTARDATELALICPAGAVVHY